jgi:AGCS family alanine or glycine:cation symporter|tara:strand:+ start:1026 stop:1259 length:234 start_codon:yes stop_codon:yes gene_type:complete
MKRLFALGATATALSLPTLAAAQDAVSLDPKVNDIFAGSTGWFVNLIFMNLPGTNFPWIVLWLVVAASIFTIYFGFI